MRLNDLISRQEAINKILEYFIEYHGGAFREDDQRALIEVFEKIPTVDAVPVEWIEIDIEASAFSGYDMHAYEVATMLEEWKEKEGKKNDKGRSVGEIRDHLHEPCDSERGS